MSLISRVQRGRVAKPPRLLLYGTEGIGKSTFAAGAPSPVFVPTEDGLEEIGADRFPLARSLADVLAALAELAGQEHDWSTVVIDSLDWLERLIWEAVCESAGVKSIELVGGGYGKGYGEAVTVWREILGRLSVLRERRGMAIILLAHAGVQRFEDPETSPYDRYAPRLDKRAVGPICEWCDAVLFATRRMRTKTEDLGFKKTRTTAAAIGAAGGERIIRATGGPPALRKIVTGSRVTSICPGAPSRPP
jgi:hypothetical protein